MTDPGTDETGRTPEETRQPTPAAASPILPGPTQPSDHLVLKLSTGPKALQEALDKHPGYRLASAYEHTDTTVGLFAGLLGICALKAWRFVGELSAEAGRESAEAAARITGHAPPAPPATAPAWDVSPLLFGLLLALVVIACSRATVAVLERVTLAERNSPGHGNS